MIKYAVRGIVFSVFAFVHYCHGADPLDYWVPGAAGTTEDLYVGDNGIILNSTNGIDWVQTASGTTNSLRAIAYGNDQLVAVGAAGTILSSTNGTSWVSRSSGTSYPIGAIAFGSGQFVAAGGYWTIDDLGILHRYGTLLTSRDGTTWTETTPLWAIRGYDFTSLAFGNGVFLVLATIGNNLQSQEMLVSTNGVDWTEQPLPTSWLISVGYGDSCFVAVGAFGIVYTSAAGVAWTRRESGTGAHLDAITWGNGRFVAVGATGSLLSSPDGAHWTSHISGLASDLYAAVYGDGRFVVTGASGALRRSGPIVRLGPLTMLLDGIAQCELTGPAGQNCAIEASTNLTDWTPLADLMLTNGRARFVEPLTNPPSPRFYRAVVP